MNPTPDTSANCKDWLTIPEAAAAIEAAGVPNYSAWTLRRMQRQNRLPFTPRVIGSRVYCLRSEVLEFIAAQNGPAASDPQEPEADWLTLSEALQALKAEGIPFDAAKAKYCRKVGRFPVPLKKFGAGRIYCRRSDIVAYIANLKNPTK